MGFTRTIPDPYNIKKLRDEFNTNRHDYNCGGYAFHTFSWYAPYNAPNHTMGEYGDRYASSGFTEEEAMRRFTKHCVRYMENDFKGKLRQIRSLTEASPNDTVILFRVGLRFDAGECWDSDFHFRVRRNGKWTEKCGGAEIEDSAPELTQPWVDWETDFTYDGPIAMFIFDDK